MTQVFVCYGYKMLTYVSQCLHLICPNLNRKQTCVSLINQDVAYVCMKCLSKKKLTQDPSSVTGKFTSLIFLLTVSIQIQESIHGVVYYALVKVVFMYFYSLMSQK